MVALEHAQAKAAYNYYYSTLMFVLIDLGRKKRRLEDIAFQHPLVFLSAYVHGVTMCNLSNRTGRKMTQLFKNKRSIPQLWLLEWFSR